MKAINSAFGGLFPLQIDTRNERVYYLTQLMHSLVFTIPIWVVFYQQRISAAQISILVTAQYISQMVMELPSGALADLLGRKHTVFFGLFIGALSYFLFPLGDSFWYFFVLALMVGVSDSFRSGSEEALLYDTYKQVGNEARYKIAYANGNIIYQAGLIVATALGGVVYELNYSLPYLFYGAALLLGSLLVIGYIEPDIDSESFSIRSYISQIISGSREAFKSTYATYLSFFYIFVGGIAWSSTLYFNAFMMVELGFSDSMRGFLTAGMRLLNVVVIASVLKSSKIFTWGRTVLFFPIIMLVGYLPGVWLDGYAGLPFVQAAMIVTTARWIILSPLTNEAFSSKYRATAISLLSLLIGVVYVVMTAASTVIIPLFGIKTMYSLLGIVTLVTVVPVAVRLLSLRNR